MRIYNEKEIRCDGDRNVMDENEKVFTDDQWDWIQDTAEGQDHVFFFTHGRIVGGGEEQRGRMVDYTEEFVEWANRPWVNMEAVFVGHSHDNRGWYNVNTANIDKPPNYYDPDDPNYISPTERLTIQFSQDTIYIETEKST